MGNSSDLVGRPLPLNLKEKLVCFGVILFAFSFDWMGLGFIQGVKTKKNYAKN